MKVIRVFCSTVQGCCCMCYSYAWLLYDLTSPVHYFNNFLFTQSTFIMQALISQVLYRYKKFIYFMFNLQS